MTATAPDRTEAARRAIVACSVELEARGLNHNSAGNVSVRLSSDVVLVTPSGIAPRLLVPDDIVVLRGDGSVEAGQSRRPTSEWRLHVDLYAARPDLAAIVHTHSPEATAAACMGRAIPAVHYVVARTGGDELPCAPYATYGSAALAANVVATLGAGRLACLMANHGVIAAGRELADALALAHDVEWLAGVHRRACEMGEPMVLPTEEIDRVARLFETYGQASE
jgi:L-fuculose-phosphate aldolase